MKHTFLTLVLLVAGAAAALAQSPPVPVVSPEVHSDNRVTFRFRAPNVKEVALSLEGAEKDLAMRKDEDGVWNLTSDSQVGTGASSSPISPPRVRSRGSESIGATARRP